MSLGQASFNGSQLMDDLSDAEISLALYETECLAPRTRHRVSKHWAGPIHVDVQYTLVRANPRPKSLDGEFSTRHYDGPRSKFLGNSRLFLLFGVQRKDDVSVPCRICCSFSLDLRFWWQVGENDLDVFLTGCRSSGGDFQFSLNDKKGSFDGDFISVGNDELSLNVETVR